MSKTLQKIYYYRSFGLIISSPFPISFLPTSRETNPDITITEGDFPRPENWDQSELFNCEPCKSEVIINLKGEPFILVRSGKEIIIHKDVKASQQEREVFILASGIASILIQRDFLLIHGATVLHKGQVIAFLGPKGIGKSTLTAALMAKGYEVLGDDICAINNDTSKGLRILTPPRTLKLTEETAEKLSIKPSAKDKHCDLKYWLELPDSQEISLPLFHIYALKTHSLSSISINMIKGTKAFELILENLYRPTIVDGLKKWEGNFNLSSSIALSLEVSEIYRPKHYFDINSLVQTIEEKVLN